MKHFLLAFCTSTLLVNSLLAAEVTIFKQWHLSPKQDTQNTLAANKLPQYANQEYIYLAAKKLIQEGKSQMLISEGCEGEIDQNFKENFNGWDYTRLTIKKAQPEFDKILTLIPLKLEVIFTNKLLTVCGDNNALVKEHQLTLSDLRAYFGYITRLQQFKGKDQKRYDEYAKMLGAPKGQDPIAFAKEKGKASLAKFKELIIKRNNSFYELALKNVEKNPMIVIGGLHAEDLEKRFKAQNIKVTVLTDDSYQKEEGALFTQLETALGK